MQRLSELNMILAILLIVILLSIGPTRYLLNTLLESTGNYAQNIISMSLWSDTQKTQVGKIGGLHFIGHGG